MSIEFIKFSDCRCHKWQAIKLVKNIPIKNSSIFDAHTSSTIATGSNISDWKNNILYVGLGLYLVANFLNQNVVHKIMKIKTNRLESSSLFIIYSFVFNISKLQHCFIWLRFLLKGFAVYTQTHITPSTGNAASDIIVEPVPNFLTHFFTVKNSGISNTINENSKNHTLVKINFPEKTSSPVAHIIIIPRTGNAKAVITPKYWHR